MISGGRDPMMLRTMTPTEAKISHDLTNGKKPTEAEFAQARKEGRAQGIGAAAVVAASLLAPVLAGMTLAGIAELVSVRLGMSVAPAMIQTALKSLANKPKILITLAGIVEFITACSGGGKPSDIEADGDSVDGSGNDGNGNVDGDLESESEEGLEEEVVDDGAASCGNADYFQFESTVGGKCGLTEQQLIEDSDGSRYMLSLCGNRFIKCSVSANGRSADCDYFGDELFSQTYVEGKDLEPKGFTHSANYLYAQSCVIPKSEDEASICYLAVHDIETGAWKTTKEIEIFVKHGTADSEQGDLHYPEAGMLAVVSAQTSAGEREVIIGIDSLQYGSGVYNSSYLMFRQIYNPETNSLGKAIVFGSFKEKPIGIGHRESEFVTLLDMGDGKYKLKFISDIKAESPIMEDGIEHSISDLISPERLLITPYDCNEMSLDGDPDAAKINSHSILVLQGGLNFAIKAIPYPAVDDEGFPQYLENGESLCDLEIDKCAMIEGVDIQMTDEDVFVAGINKKYASGPDDDPDKYKIPKDSLSILSRPVNPMNSDAGVNTLNYMLLFDKGLSTFMPVSVDESNNASIFLETEKDECLSEDESAPLFKYEQLGRDPACEKYQ